MMRLGGVLRRIGFAAVPALVLVAPALAQDEKAPARGPGAGFVPADAPVVVTFRPAAVLKRPDVKELFDELTEKDEVRRLVDVAEPETIEEVTLALLSRDVKGGRDPGEVVAESGVVIVRTNKPREWKALAAAAGLPLVKGNHAGKDYYRINADASHVMGFYQPDEMTVVAASDANLRKLIEGSAADAPKGSRVPRDTKGEGTMLAAAAVDFAWVRDLLAPAVQQDKGAGVALALVGPIWEKTQDATARLSAEGDRTFTLSLEHACADEDGARGVEKTLDAFLTLGRNVAPEALKAIRQEHGKEPAAAEVADLAESALKSAEVAREGTRVRVKVAVKADLAKLLRMLMHG